MIRVILELKKENNINMVHTREKISMISVNQISVYHTLLEAYNIMKNSASVQIQLKWTYTSAKKYSLRSAKRDDLQVPEKPVLHIMDLGSIINSLRI